MAAATVEASNAAAFIHSAARLAVQVERVGLTYHTLKMQPYWDESAYWEFSSGGNRSSGGSHSGDSAAGAGGWRCDPGARLLAQMGISEKAAERIRETWQSEPPALYGRLDLAYDGRRSSCWNTTPTRRLRWSSGRRAMVLAAGPAFRRPTNSIRCMKSWWRSGRICAVCLAAGVLWP